MRNIPVIIAALLALSLSAVAQQASVYVVEHVDSGDVFHKYTGMSIQSAIANCQTSGNNCAVADQPSYDAAVAATEARLNGK